MSYLEGYGISYSRLNQPSSLVPPERLVCRNASLQKDSNHKPCSLSLTLEGHNTTHGIVIQQGGHLDAAYLQMCYEAAVALEISALSPVDTFQCPDRGKYERVIHGLICLAANYHPGAV